MLENLMLLWAVAAILSIWVIVLTVYIFMLRSKGANTKPKPGFDFTTMGDDAKIALEKSLTTLYRRTGKAIQRVGVVRFNPFKDVGSDQSFAIAMLDEEGNGVVFSSIHARAATRVYAKVIVQGKNLQHELSEEEQKAIDRALE